MYLAVGNLKENLANIPPVAKPFAVGIVLVGYTADVLLNLIPGSIFFFEPPSLPTKDELRHFNLERLTFTYRCETHKNSEEDSWRKTEGAWWCKNFMDPFWPGGKHCK